MATPNQKVIVKIFENRLQELTEDNIIALSKHDISIFNVIRGLHKESLSTLVLDDSKPDFDYFLLYSTIVKEKLEGFICRLQPHLKTRNELTTCFASFICKRYNIKESHSIFNTFQDQQRSLFERLNYWTYDDSLRKELKGRQAEIILKGQKGILYVPFVTVPSDEPVKKGIQLTQPTKANSYEANGQNFVYLMHNRRNGYYKIGRSIKPEYRERTLQSEEPEIVLTEKWIASATVENVLHRKFKEKRIRGEWFSLTEIDIIEIKTFMATIIEAISSRKSKRNATG